MLWVIGAAALLQGLISLRAVRRWLAFVRASVQKPPGGCCPPVTVIVPCRGRDLGLEQNLAAYRNQDYPDLELLFVTSGAADPAAAAAQAVSGARVLYVAPRPDEGEKVTKLRAAVREVRPNSEVLVFADSDGRPGPRWLRHLVAPLAAPEQEVGATTGYRWYVSARSSAAIARAVWNSFTASLLDDGDAIFCWGGSVAVRRSTFERLDVDRFWQGSVSDDYRLSAALKGAGLPIRFVPSCLVPSPAECSWSELMGWTTRQVLITRVYAPRLWVLGLLANGLYCASVAALLAGLPSVLAASLLAALFLTSILTGATRAAGARAAGIEPRSAGPAFALLAPLIPFLLFYNFARAGFTRTVEWRGTSYRLLGPQQTVVIGREATCASGEGKR